MSRRSGIAPLLLMAALAGCPGGLVVSLDDGTTDVLTDCRVLLTGEDEEEVRCTSERSSLALRYELPADGLVFGEDEVALAVAPIEQAPLVCVATEGALRIGQRVEVAARLHCSDGLRGQSGRLDGQARLTRGSR